MCNLSEGIYEEGLEKGVKKVVESILLDHLPDETIMKYAGITKERLNEIKEELLMTV